MEAWNHGAAYEAYVGRWSRVVAREFLAWLSVPEDAHWLDAGCGAGALSDAILKSAVPASVIGIDKSPGFVAHARRNIDDERATFLTGDMQSLPFNDVRFDAAVAALVLNHLPSPARGLAELNRVTRAGGIVATYVWDYSENMQMLKRFWESAVELDPAARERDQALRYPGCNPQALSELFMNAGLISVATRAIDIPTVFRNFDEYWAPFLGGQGPAPSYVVSLSETKRNALRERLRQTLPVKSDGSIHLIARAWAVRGTRPGHGDGRA